MCSLVILYKKSPERGFIFYIRTEYHHRTGFAVAVVAAVVAAGVAAAGPGSAALARAG